jgi:hypothetical protein
MSLSSRVASVSNIVTVNHKTLGAHLPAGAVGYTVFWSLTGEVPVASLATSWDAAGLNPDLLPAAPSFAASFSRACNAEKSDTRLVRPVKGGFAFVRETPDNKGKVSHDVEAYVYHDATHNVFKSEAGTLTQAETDALQRKVEAAVAHHRAHYAINDLSLWVTTRVKAQRAVALRPTGGFYFVPPSGTATIDAMKAALAPVGVTIFVMASVHNDTAAEAIVAALASEVETMASKVTGEIDAEEVGSRALKSREDAARELASKVEHYESVIGQSLATIQSKLGGLQHSIVVAMAKADSDGDAE